MCQIMCVRFCPTGALKDDVWEHYVKAIRWQKKTCIRPVWTMCIEGHAGDSFTITVTFATVNNSGMYQLVYRFYRVRLYMIIMWQRLLETQKKKNHKIHTKICKTDVWHWQTFYAEISFYDIKKIIIINTKN